MNKEKISAMTAGKLLDSLVAEDVMGVSSEMFEFMYEAGMRNYSTDISAAWEVVEQITKEYRITLYKLPGGDWSCKFSDFPQIIEHSAPEAICKAALLAVMNS